MTPGWPSAARDERPCIMNSTDSILDPCLSAAESAEGADNGVSSLIVRNR